ncbi:hypothetical protein SAMN05428985_107106 [Nocardioides sp. YR527]|uniref:DUF7144 family membrane protein n=1 Tax=Nocardioides sp. YR527 TaxID=1881028 RepID=UPI000889F5E5|nr:hypothetical protein [Nocardioides sp. YR527]SDK94006.1 hypothetical protein SAMN05428985_107106 [Nocardioides sp. YR527]
MTEQTTPNDGTTWQAEDPPPSRAQEPPPSGLATGFIMFAGVMMIMAGSFQAFAGLVGIFEDEFYVATPNYLLELDATTWGWIHLVLGLLVVLAGFAVLNGMLWGRIIGVILAVLSACANFAFLPYSPFWSTLIIAVDIFVIWALTAHGRDITR